MKVTTDRQFSPVTIEFETEDELAVIAALVGSAIGVGKWRQISDKIWEEISTVMSRERTVELSNKYDYDEGRFQS